MRRLLFLAYWVPPSNFIGSIRAKHVQRFLPEFGWEVTTLTPRFDAGQSGENGARYVMTGYWDLKAAVKRVFAISGRGAHEAFHVEIPKYGERRGLAQRVIAGAASMVTYPDDWIGWLPFAFAALRRASSRCKWDAVLSTAPPMTVNLAVSLARPPMPWIADFRDLWAEADYTERSRLQKRLDDRLERATLSRAAALTASSEFSAERLRKRYPGKPCFAVSTGFDADDWNGIEFGREQPCTLVYAGTLYRGKRDPSVLFSALRRILDRGWASKDEVRADFYSAREGWLTDLIAQFGLEDVVRVRGLVDRKSVLTAQRRADRLVVLCWDGEAAEGILPGKVFEYFGARRPILAVGGPQRSAVRDLLQQTAAGAGCTTDEEVVSEILTALFEHRSAPRIVPGEAVAAYSGRNCAQRFAQVLNSVVDERAAVGGQKMPVYLDGIRSRTNEVI